VIRPPKISCAGERERYPRVLFRLAGLIRWPGLLHAQERALRLPDRGRWGEFAGCAHGECLQEIGDEPG
jgi:hypothetical protein